MNPQDTNVTNDPAAAPVPTGAGGFRRSLTLYFGSELMLSVGIGLVNYAQPFFFQYGSMTDAQIGVLFAANSIGSGIAALLLGPPADRIGASVGWKWATLLIGIGYLWTSVARGFVSWLIASVFTGAAAGLLMATENVVLSSLTPEDNKASVLSRFVAFYMCAIGAGMVAGGWLSAAYGYRTTMLAGAAVTLTSPCIRWFVRAPDVLAKRAFRRPPARLAAMGACSAGIGVALGLFTPFVTLVLKARFGLDDHVVSVISAVGTFAVSLGAYAVSHVVRRLPSDAVIAWTFAAAGLSTLGLVMAGQPLLFTILYLVRAMSASASGPVVDAMFLERTPPTEQAQMFGVRVFANTMGNALGSTAAGMLLERGQLVLGLCLSAGMFGATYFYLRRLLIRLRRGAVAQTSVAAQEPPTSQ